MQAPPTLPQTVFKTLVLIKGRAPGIWAGARVGAFCIRGGRGLVPAASQQARANQEVEQGRQ